MHQERSGHTATLLRDGTVLIAGGGNVLTTAEIYDPVTETFAMTGSMHWPRFDHSATLLFNGGVLIAGGDDPNLNANRTAELYSPGTHTFFGNIQHDDRQRVAQRYATGQWDGITRRRGYIIRG
jgi:hypothetical protein